MDITSPLNRPQPVPDLDTAPFWEGTRHGKLLIQRCADCGKWHFPPSDMCPYCLGWDSTWEEASGMGRLYSWIVIHHPVIASLKDQVPLVVGLVELEEAVRLPANLVDIQPEAIWAEMPLRLRFQEIAGGFTIPVFGPAAD